MDGSATIGSRTEGSGPVPDSALLNRAAYACIQNDELDKALALLTFARNIDPANPDVLNSLGCLQRRRGETNEALNYFQRACEASPTNTAARFNLASMFEDLGDHESAKAQYNAVIAHAQNDPEALSRLFYLSAIDGAYEEAQRYGESALGSNGAETIFGQLSSIALQRADFGAARGFAEQAVAANASPRAITSLAHAEFRDGDPERARQRLTELLGGPLTSEERAFALSVLGDIEDKLGNYDAAFEGYAKSKAILAEEYAPHFAQPGQRTGAMLVEDLHAFFSRNELKLAERDLIDETAPLLKEHIFLVSFPRSGTTLLEQSLAMHPDICTLDEADIFMPTTAPLWSTPQGLQALARADKDSLSKIRKRYWAQVKQRLPNLDSKVLIDKMPMNSIIAPAIAQLFPNAKILFPVRDPRDVVFSCFRTRFTMTAFMYEFCSPPRAAHFYSSVMSLFELYRRILPIQVLETRYEDLVDDFPGSIARVCDFLGVDFLPEMSKPETRARSRLASTPSGAQIARGLYNGSQQWRPYGAHLAEIVPVLEPWLRRFGYSAEALPAWAVAAE